MTDDVVLLDLGEKIDQMSRKELRKTRGIKSNLKTVEMRHALNQLQTSYVFYTKKQISNPQNTKYIKNGSIASCIFIVIIIFIIVKSLGSENIDVVFNITNVAGY